LDNEDSLPWEEFEHNEPCVQKTVKFAPTRGEVEELYKYWVRKVDAIDNFCALAECVNGSDHSRKMYALKRLRLIEFFLGSETTKKLDADVTEEYRRKT